MTRSTPEASCWGKSNARPKPHPGRLGRASNLILVLKELGEPGDRLGHSAGLIPGQVIGHLGHLVIFLGVDEGEPVPMIVLDAIAAFDLLRRPGRWQPSLLYRYPLAE